MVTSPAFCLAGGNGLRQRGQVRQQGLVLQNNIPRLYR